MKRNDFHTQKALNLFSAITIHNIPEGLAVGFAVGTAILDGTQAFGALMFALGIALQNFPEGLATALPLSTALKSRKKGAFLGILSGIVEPIFAVVGILLSTYIASILPWLLAFAAGSMIFVIIKELLPEIDQSQNTLGTIFFTIGFIIMMLLDICL